MLRQCHPADELAALREKMRGLKAREMELRKMLLHGTCGLTGATHEAVFRKLKRRVFRKERLPKYILSEDTLWETRHVTHLVSRSREDVPPVLRAIRPGDPVLVYEADRDWGVPTFEVIERVTPSAKAG